MIYKISFRAMGCQMAALLETSPDQKDILEDVPVWFENWEAVLSRFRPQSELNRLNQHSGVSMPVSPILWQVLRLSQKVERQSDGLISPVVLSALEAAGYHYSFEQGITTPLSVLQNLPAPLPDLSELILVPKKHFVTLPPGMRLDLGGVAKGWAAHQAMLRLQKYGAALVDAGGDIAISASPQTAPTWPVAIRHPLDESATLGTLHIQTGGVATSGKDFRRWKQDGRLYHHIIDPRTGQPAQTDLLTVTILASNVIQAEMAAKTVFILGSRAGLNWLAKRPNLAALLVFEDGSYQATPNLLPVWERQ